MLALVIAAIASAILPEIIDASAMGICAFLIMSSRPRHSPPAPPPRADDPDAHLDHYDPEHVRALEKELHLLSAMSQADFDAEVAKVTAPGPPPLPPRTAVEAFDQVIEAESDPGRKAALLFWQAWNQGRGRWQRR